MDASGGHGYVGIGLRLPAVRLAAGGDGDSDGHRREAVFGKGCVRCLEFTPKLELTPKRMTPKRPRGVRAENGVRCLPPESAIGP